MRSPGPARAEEVDIQSLETQLEAEYADVVDKIKKEVEDGQVKVYKVYTGLRKEQYFVVGLHTDGERTFGVRTTDLSTENM